MLDITLVKEYAYTVDGSVLTFPLNKCANHIDIFQKRETSSHRSERHERFVNL